MKCQRETTKGGNCKANLVNGKCQYHGQKEPTPTPTKVDILPVTIPNSLWFVDYLEMRLVDHGFDEKEFLEYQRQSIEFTDPLVAGFAWNRFLDRFCTTMSKDRRDILNKALGEFFNPVSKN
jgi:hypothetical protein